MSPQPNSGTLYLVSTPIGNLGDITCRAVEVLRSVKFIAAEDTRRTRILTQHYGLKTPLVSFHDHNKTTRTPQLLQVLNQGDSVALVSDAGTPGISDPGFYLVRAAISAGIPVTPVPGPVALIAALVVSGLATDRFVFEGFLPARSGPRKRRLEELAQETRTVIFYESPHRIQRTCEELLAIWGDRPACLARELTKKFEEIRRGLLSELLTRSSQQRPRGEMVLVVAGQSV